MKPSEQPRVWDDRPGTHLNGGISRWRPFFCSALALLAFSLCARADERYVEFIQRLQELGYHDLVAEYVKMIRQRPEVPHDVKVLAEYYIGKSLLAGADQVPDLTGRDEQLQRAWTHLERFVERYPQHDREAEARMDLAGILIERGRVALVQADFPENAANREAVRRKARSLFDAARTSFGKARDRFAAELKKFPPFIPEDQKRQREAKAATQVNLMQAHLHLGLVEYEFAQTYDASSADYTRTLQRAFTLFENVRTQFRYLLGGQYARMWQGKCFEEMGELTKAEGIYKELMEHEDKDTAMQALQRQVRFFQIIVLNKRGDHVMAADLARQWLAEHATLRHTEVGLGVQFEMAKGLIQEADRPSTKSGDRNRLLSQAMDALAVVGRYKTVYQQSAIRLQQKHRPRLGTSVAVLDYDKAVALGDEAKDRNAWGEAAKLYARALQLADDNLETAQLASLRYKLSVASFQAKKYYEAAVLGEYVARRQAGSKYAAPAAHVALEAYAEAINDLMRLQHATDFEEARISQLADYITQTWPTAGEANAARVLVGELHLHHGRFEAAGQAFGAVSPNSPDYARLLGRAADAYWQAYVAEALQPSDGRDTEKMVRSLQKARETLEASVRVQKKDLKPDAPVPVELAEVQIRLAEVSIESGQGVEAVKLMQELAAKTQTQQDLRSLELRSLIALIRGAIATQDLAAAETTMKAIEATGRDLAQITRIYLDLGKQLQSEMERLKVRGDTDKYRQTRDRYVSFLNQLAARREGQTFTTLWWTGEAFFGLELYDQAAGRFGEIVSRTLADPKFLDQSKAEHRSALVQAKLRYATSLRKQKRFTEAWEQIKPLPPESNTAKDPIHVGPTTNLDIIMERGFVLQEWGDRDPNRLKTAIDHWAYWGQQLEKLQPRPPQYWEVRLNLVRSLVDRARKPADTRDREQRLKQAQQQLLLLTRTSTNLGGPALKAEFKKVQQELERELGQPIGGHATPTTASKPAGK